jgi:SAM-dependent methyltransferase
MSEDTTAKPPGHRRRRTTRAGRRRAGRPVNGPTSDSAVAGNDGASDDRWTPVWEGQSSADPETLPGEALEELQEEEGDEPGEAEADGGEAEAAGEGGCDAALDELETAETQPPEAGGSARDEDAHPTVEMVIRPLSLAQLQNEDEKTQPRIRVNDLVPERYASIQDEPPPEPVQIWSRPSSRNDQPEPEEGNGVVVAVLPSVIIAPARVIAERGSAPRAPAPEPEAAPAPAPAAPTEAARPKPETAPMAAAPAAPVQAAVPARPTGSPSPPPPPPPPEALIPRTTAAAPQPPSELLAAAQAAPAATSGDEDGSQFESFGEELAELPSRGSDPGDEGGLQLVDVDVSDLDAARRSRTPPPPPPDARAKLAQAKRPPPPPAPPPPKPAVEDERTKRKQARQWWERFFSDDYLMSVIAPAPAQVSKQVDFIEQSLNVPKGGTILDVGCGLGLHSVELTRRGYLVVGLDLSLAMITRAAELAQEQQLKLNVVHADIREMEFDGAFDGVICMGTTFGFFDDDSNRDVLARLFAALRPGGRVLLDTVNRDYVIKSQPNLVWYEGDECVCMEESDFNYFNSRLTVKRTMMREDGRQSQAEYSLRLYSLHELGHLMQQVGFRVIEVSGQEAIRGAFFGTHSPRVLMLAERRPPAATRPSSTVVPLDRNGGAGEGRGSQVAFPAERGSAEIPKIPRSD